MGKDIFDILIYETGAGGDLSLKNDDIETISGITNQVYLALFGGNKEQSTDDELTDLEVRSDWWGNNYLDIERQFNSEFERMLMTQALTVNGLSKLEDAANEDLEYLRAYADIEVFASMPGVNRLLLEVSVKEPNNKSSKVKLLWDGTRKEIIENIII